MGSSMYWEMGRPLCCSYLFNCGRHSCTLLDQNRGSLSMGGCSATVVRQLMCQA